MPALPPFSKPIIAAAVLLDIVVFAMGIRAFPVLALMIVVNLAVCLLIYWTILGHFFSPKPSDDDQSPSRKSSPISE